MPPDVYSITLAAGVSSRMPKDMRPKSCCKVGTLSVIENTLTAYEQAGITRHVVVIGHAAEQVMDEVTRKRRDVLFAYQSRPRGTGDAVECALELLAGIGPPESVFITAGDKVIAPYVIRGLLERYADTGCDLCLAARPGGDYPDAGRILARSGRVQAIVEAPDIRVRQLAAKLRSLPKDRRPATVQDLRELADEFFTNTDPLVKCFPAIGKILSVPPDQPIAWEKVIAAAEAVPDGFALSCGTVSTQEAASTSLTNVSIYVGRFGPLREAVKELRADNVQGQRYFPDVAEIFASDGRDVRLFRLRNAEDVMSFNTLPELEAVREVHAERSLSAVEYPSLERWENYLARRDGTDLLRAAVRKLSGIIGPDRPAFLVRSPGRINLMGRHVDHQGGTCNLMAIDHEITMAVSPRQDDRINLWNADSAEYPARSFTIGELTADMVWEDWLHTLNTQFIRRTVSMGAGDWVNYVKGAALRLQHRFRDRRFRGMDAFVSGNIPVAAGLSSSSALLVAASEAMIELNALNVRLGEFVDLCGEGEWFVGARGGSADHAVIKHGREKEVLSVSFLPFRILAHHPFPEDCSLIVCHSGLSAGKTESARERLNVRVACYHMAREVIKRKFPRLAPRIEHLRDVNTRNLELSLPAIYNILLQLPNQMRPEAVGAMARKHPGVAECLVGVEPTRNTFPLRDMALYGLAECERSSRAGSLLDRGDVERLGRMMNISHDGDRVARWDLEQSHFNSSTTDEQIRSLVKQSTALQPLDESGAALWQQPGAYDCSTPEIDLMVDSVSDCPGVVGAQLSGAGLGGCIMILARRDAVDEVKKALTRRYYEPREIEPRMFVCHPSGGSHILTVVDAER